MNRAEVEKIIKPENMKAFDKFMNGQTVGINKDKSIDYYEIDVMRFKNALRNHLE